VIPGKENKTLSFYRVCRILENTMRNVGVTCIHITSQLNYYIPVAWRSSRKTNLVNIDIQSKLYNRSRSRLKSMHTLHVQKGSACNP
jgi:hypothetical protein